MNNIPLSRIVLAVAGIMAVVSLFLPWTHLLNEMKTYTGWQAQGWIPLLAWTYPMLCLLFNKHMHKVVGIINSIFVIGLSFWGVAAFTGIVRETQHLQEGGAGIWLFLVASFTLLYGCIIDKEEVYE